MQAQGEDLLEFQAGFAHTSMRHCIPLVLCIALAGCGGGSGSAPQFHVGGTVSGLSGTGLVLQDNGSDSLTPPASGPFTFATELENGKSYAVTVAQQPANPAQTCVVANGSGAVSGADVSTVAVTCTTNSYSIGGTVAGLQGGPVVLENNNGDVATVTADGAFTFPTRVLSGAGYSVDVKTQPANPSQTCTVASGTGTVGTAAVSLMVKCLTNYAVRVHVSGLSASRYTTGVTLQDNGADDLTLGSNGTGTFARLITDGSGFDVTIKAQPSLPAQTCTVVSGAATINGAAADVVVNCVGNRAQFLYVTDYNAGVDVFSIAANGSTQSVQTQPIAGAPDSAVVDPSGQFLYVSTQFGGTGLGSVFAFSIDPSSGMLTPIGTEIPESAVPHSITVDPTGNFVYVANSYGGATSQGSVTVFSADLTTGGLAPAPVTYTVNYDPFVAAVSPDLGSLYTADSSGTAGAYSINRTNGALTGITGSPFSAGATTVAREVIVSTDARFVYLICDLGIVGYARDSMSGSLEALSSTPLVQSVAGPVAADPLGQYLYVADTEFTVSGQVVSLKVDPQTGDLATISPMPTLTTRPDGIAVDPSGMFVYTLTVGGGTPTGGAVEIYSVDRGSGVLSAVTTVTVHLSPTAIAVR